jgi:hypothetical protein
MELFSILSKLFVSLLKDLRNSSMSSLRTLCKNLENKIRENNEILVQEFALRDESEFEKETKNTFISLLHNIQVCK